MGLGLMFEACNTTQQAIISNRLYEVISLLLCDRRSSLITSSSCSLQNAAFYCFLAGFRSVFVAGLGDFIPRSGT